MSIVNFFHTYAVLIDEMSNIFTAIGTVSAVIVSVWFAFRDTKPKPKVYATIGITIPGNSEYLWLTCVNISKQSIICTGFSFNPNKFRKQPERIMPVNPVQNLSSSLPKNIAFSDRIDQYFASSFFSDPKLLNSLSRHKFLARIQLKFLWRVVAITNIKEFEGRLSNSLIDRILLSQFSTKEVKESL